MSTQTRIGMTIDRRRLPMFDYVVLTAVVAVMGIGTLGSLGRGVERPFRCVSAAIAGPAARPAVAIVAPERRAAKAGRGCEAGSDER